MPPRAGLARLGLKLGRKESLAELRVGLQVAEVLGRFQSLEPPDQARSETGGGRRPLWSLLNVLGRGTFLAAGVRVWHLAFPPIGKSTVPIGCIFTFEWLLMSWEGTTHFMLPPGSRHHGMSRNATHTLLHQHTGCTCLVATGLAARQALKRPSKDANLGRITPLR